MKLQVILCATLMVASAIMVHASDPPAADSTSESSGRASAHAVQDAAEVGSVVTRRSFMRSFADLAPRQKVMGLVNAIALLRTKISLVEEMKTAFEPRFRSSSSGLHAGHPLPGPALGYIDCRLGLLGFEVCRHLGFLDSDPMVAPSSTQSKMLTLLGASSLVASLKAGHLHLKADPELEAVLGPELMEAAVRALGACWNAQLLFPAFDARPSSDEQIAEAIYHADSFLFLTAMQAKKILRFSRSDYEGVGHWLASIFSDLQTAEAMSNGVVTRESKSQKTPTPTSKNENKEEKLPEKPETKPTGAKAEVQPSERQQPNKEVKVPESADNKVTRPQEEASASGIFGNFLSRIFPSQTQQTASGQENEQAAASPNVLSAIANSVGGLTSIVTGATYTPPKSANVEVPAGATPEATALSATQQKLGGILDMIPEEVDGQF